MQHICWHEGVRITATCICEICLPSGLLKAITPCVAQMFIMDLEKEHFQGLQDTIHWHFFNLPFGAAKNVLFENRVLPQGIPPAPHRTVELEGLELMWIGAH